MFKAYNKVRMHDTDMAGILYFAKQFRYVHDAFEDLCESLGLGLDTLFHQEEFVFVIVHAEADFLAPLRVGDLLEIEASLEKIGNSSFTIDYNIYRQSDRCLVGTAKTVHVTLDQKSRKKIELPAKLRALLSHF